MGDLLIKIKQEGVRWLLLCTLLYGLGTSSVYATDDFSLKTSIFQQQSKKIAGQVTDASGVPLPGVNILVKGTNIGVTTDFDGKFEINVPNDKNEIVFSFIGFKEQTLQVTQSRSNVKIILQEETQQLEQVVVTALGIKRQEKALSYNVQQVNSEELTKVKDANFVNSLSGKVAGVTIQRSSSGIGGATKVVMRGAKSIEKSNNALYVIDGVPLFSTTMTQGSGRFQSTGSTEGIADINPEDIESMTVLTGASAAALYGSAAANGAILITTKKGKEGKLQVNFSSNTEISTPLILPKFQNTYGSDGTITSWGAKLPDNVEKYDPKDFFKTGYTFTNNISLSGGNEKNQTYFSASSTQAEGIVPNNQYNRYNFTFRNTAHLLNDKLKIDGSVNYILQDHRNMINQGEYMNPLVGAYLLPRGESLASTRTFERYNPARKIYEQEWRYGTGDYTLQNPYWVAYRNLRDVKRERNMIALGVSYDLRKWSETEKWDIAGRVRTDNSHIKSTDKRYATTAATLDVSKNGYFGLLQGTERQTYTDILTNFSKRFNLGEQNIVITANLGASLQDTRYDDSQYTGPIRENGIPNVFNTFNIDQGAQKTKAGQAGWIEQTQSVFGSFEAGYNGYLYLTLTGRNDWASQLANSPNSSFFYPSVGLSAVVTDMLSSDTKVKINPILSFMKVRLAFSSVGSPFDRGLTTPTYSFDQDTKTWKTVSHFPIGSLYPERTNSYEAGIASKWLKGKLTLDVTFYQTNTKNQTISSEISPSTGYDKIYLQTGDVRNRGIELGLGYDFQMTKDFNWNSHFTMGYNKNEIMSLVEDYVNPVTGEQEGKESLVKNSFGSLRYVLKKGGSLGDVYTNADFTRDSDGNIYVDANGNITKSDFSNGHFEKLGSVLPDFTLGWRNDFTYKNFSFGAMLSGRIGGIAVSMTEAALDHYGVSKNSGLARDAGGVLIGGLRVNPKNYFEVRGKNQLAQYYTYSATNFRLQEAYISYKLPKKILNDQMGLTLSVVGRNLVMIYNKAPFDPESVSSTGNYVQGLDYFMIPSQRSFGLGVKADF
ncbi:SusC/RagA family TonB-linked outer membrane protein [Capnocytophaga catalasegens]|uniref:SusC/RagA family TonB-linked outer membrane protein n=1 Tax=Capnocytophaga catalasegens TaxID=1004260 RepID=A0AAV5ARY4_9FLAO|nr:SusC/RagA family TonB-linked outer membrane protein [Capnocytophaga catalasegens]GIZ15712.1 SusC/RagA family TonB-linked outer membrane protein [Capnocytophaga catalasegens]GJM50099.1 SusC/RagA family TonB-linked outer membrane protein [Capnocytophaga catalasegens]GJM53076.1 SusC/RagA family TonB-linked outer membrane protein [Capnocytophaga catalasegens]